VCPDLGTGGLERLQPVEMVGVVVADDDAADRLLRHAADGLHHCLAQGWGAKGVEDDHAFLGDDEAGVRHETCVGVVGHA